MNLERRNFLKFSLTAIGILAIGRVIDSKTINFISGFTDSKSKSVYSGSVAKEISTGTIKQLCGRVSVPIKIPVKKANLNNNKNYL